MGLNVVQKLIESHLLSGTMTAGKCEDAPGWRRALTIGVPGFPPSRSQRLFLYSTFRDHPGDL
jgi:hypothetical protein